MGMQSYCFRHTDSLYAHISQGQLGTIYKPADMTNYGMEKRVCVRLVNYSSGIGNQGSCQNKLAIVSVSFNEMSSFSMAAVATPGCWWFWNTLKLLTWLF